MIGVPKLARAPEGMAAATPSTERDADGAVDESLWDGLQRYLDDYVQLDPADDVIVAYTPDSRTAAAWVALAVAERGRRPAILPMAPLRDPGFAKRLAAVLPPPRSDGEAGRCLLLMFERDTMSHNGVVRQALAAHDPARCKVVRAINSGRDLFVTGMSVPPERLSALNAAILERCRTARRLHIETAAGTDLHVEIDNSRFRWISNRGVWRPGKFLVVPSGEVATFPATISGRLVADFAINVNTWYPGDARLHAHPVSVDVAEGALAEYHCADAAMRGFLESCFARENARYVGELGLGTHVGVTEAVPENSHLNERVPGVHLGFGQHNQTVEAAGYFCDVHVDLCAKGGRIRFDGSEDVLDLEAVTPSAAPHPELVGGEDVVSDDPEDDCCGLLT